jgi:hypothetical protein
MRPVRSATVSYGTEAHCCSAPAREAAHVPDVEYVLDRYEGPNEWFGPPSDAIDNKWKKFVHREYFVVELGGR